MLKANSGEVFVIKASERDSGIKNLLNRFDLSEFSGKHVALKANFNSADSFPASTHLDTLGAIVENLKEKKVADVTLGERSGMGKTRHVLEKIGVFVLSRKLDFNTIVLDELGNDGWVKIEHAGLHWLRGFYIAKMFLDADKVIQTCCVKTHRFGGHFTLSLKNSVGLVAKKVPEGVYDYMWELHGSPFQRLLIAEINKFYRADLIIMDGMKAFVNDGPERGTEVEPELLLASGDRVAIDAAGVAVLRSYGITHNLMKGRIFDLEQIKHAAELGIGVKSANEILVTPVNEKSKEVAEKLAAILQREG